MSISDIRGLLLVGVSNTVLFEGSEVTELIFVNLETGEDISLPVTEEQAAHVLAFVPDGLQAEPPGTSGPERGAFAVQSIVPAGSVDGPQSVDRTPQL